MVTENGQSDGNTSFLRAARNGQLDKVLEHLKSNIDINTSNANGLNALHLASKDGHVEIVKELLKRGAVVDAATKKGNTALHIASLAGQEEVVKLLVQHGASVNVQSQNGFTPLYMAAQENHDNVVKFLLSNGANQSLSTEDGFTPLAVAMQQGHDKVVTVLLENDTRGKVRLPALHIAAKKDDVKAAKLLLENEHNPDVTSKSGFTPLHIASHYGNQQIANLLIQKGADVNYAAKHNITPLHVAAKWGKTNMVALLLEHGATIDSKTRDGLTPLHCAARSGHEQVVDMLLERGAPISSKTKNGLAPLHMAAQGDHVDAARILLFHRAPVDEVTVDYLTALHVAAHCGHVRVAKLLLDRQADANARALNGFTPLHIACKKNRIKVVELLLKHGANIGATTESGLTPLHVASFMGCMNIVIYLLQHDANPDVPTVRGETPLHLAARANQTDIIRILLRNGAQVDARAREQQTPLHIASRLGNVDIVMLLLQHGAKVDNTTKDMYTALHIAAKEGQDEVAAVLLDNGASLDATTKKGFTPLHLAAKYGHLKVANLLLQKEAPVDAQGKNGVTPLHVAAHYDHQNVALLLLDKGASPHATAKNGHTPLHIAARKNQMDIANTLLEYGAHPNAESKAGFTPLHLSAQEGHSDMSALLLEHKANADHEAKNGLTPLHLCAQEDRVPVAEVLVKNGANVNAATKGGYTPLHIASHYGQINMVRFLLKNGANIESVTSLNYTPLHQAAQQGHANIVNVLLENNADPNAVTTNGQTPLTIAQKLGYITVIETLKVVTTTTTITTTTTTNIEEKYRVQAPELMHETFMSDSEEEGGEDTVLGDQTYRYLTADEMKSLGDDSLPIDVTRDERIDSNRMVSSADSNMLPPQHIEDSISPEHVSQNYVEFIKKYTPDNVDIARHPINIGKLHWKNFLVSFLVDARGGAMRGCRHSGVRVIVPPRCAPSPTRITCRYVRPQRTPHPPPLMEGEALASRVLELGPVGAKFLGPVIIEVPHFAALRGKEREIVILRSDNGESWKEHTVEASEDVLNDVLHDSFDAEDLNQLEDMASGRITRIVTQDFPQYFAVVSRVRQEVHAIGPEGGMVSSTVVPQVQAVFPEGALTKKIKVGLQAQPIDPELTAKLLGHGVAVSPVVTVEPRRRKFHKAITLSMPAPRAHSQGMINQYSGSAPTLRLLCSITGGTTRAQWEDVTGSTPLTFVNDCVSFTTTVSARFWLMDCRNISDATKMATELYKEAIHVPFMAKFVVFAKRVDPLEARLRVFCMTDDKEDKTLEHQEHFTEVAKSRDVEVLEGKQQYIEFAGNLVPVTKSGEQLSFSFRAFRENRLPFTVRVKDQHAEAVSRCLFMKEQKVPKGESPQQPICILNILLPDDIVTETISLTDTDSLKKYRMVSENYDYYRPDPRLADMSNLLGEDWVPLANQLGLTTSEINVIKSEYPDSVAKQAQSMLRMWLSQSGNKAQTNTLENALRRIGREDIIPQCLNPDQSEHGVTRIKQEEIGTYRLKSERDNILEKADDVGVRIERKEVKKIYHLPDKYSAEEKAVEKSDEEEEEAFDKPVSEIRERIEKRLSAERSIPASSQRKEIVQEITTIKQQSLVEDKLAEVKQKVLDQKEITKPTMTKVLPTHSDLTTVSRTVEIKTTESPSEPTVSETVTTTTVITTTETRTTAPEEVTHITEDLDLLQGVTQSFEKIKTPVVKIAADLEDPKSPKYSKTPPPSPADFLIKERAATAREWEASKQPLELEFESRTPKLEQDASQEESSCVQLTETEAAKLLTPTDTNQFPQPKPRTLKTSETSPKEDLEHDKPQSPVRDDLLDSDDVPGTYSDKKKFWENVIQESSQTQVQKRMSFQDTTKTEKEQVPKKRVSIHEISVPIPKPRTTLQTSLSMVEREEHTPTKDADIIELIQDTSSVSVKQRAMSYETPSEQPIMKTEPKLMTEYQESFQPPTDKKPVLKKSHSQDKGHLKKKDSIDSDLGAKGSGNNTENAGYISDSEDVEHYISDSEIEDRVPQIRDRLMSVFVPSASSSNKPSIYTRSASLPTEDLYEVSARSIKARKEYYEAQIRKEMIEEQLTSEIEEAPSPERKSVMSSEEDHTDADAKSIGEDVEELSEEKTREEGEKPIMPETIQKEVTPSSQEHETEYQPKQAEQPKPTTPVLAIKPTENDFESDSNIPHKLFESQQSISSDRSGDMLDEQNYRDDSHSTKPDSMEVLVDKSEIEDSEKLADLDQELEGRSVDSLDIDDLPKMTNAEDIMHSIEPAVNLPREQIPDTVWEVSVQSHSEKFAEKTEDIASVQKSTASSKEIKQSKEEKKPDKQKPSDLMTIEAFLKEEKKLSTSTEKATTRKHSGDAGEDVVKDDDLSSSVRDESDLGSEIHQDHSDSYDSDKLRSESHSEIEKIILESLHQQKVHPEEAQKIANALIEEIEAEIQKRHFEPAERIEADVLEKAQVSELLKHLAETKGLDEREVQLVQSVLARKQTRFKRGDTQASSMEITDEDLKFSGAETDYSHMLEQQIDQLEAEKIADTESLKTHFEDISKLTQDKLRLSDKSIEQNSEETETSQDYKFYDNEKTISMRENAMIKSADLIKNEKYQYEEKETSEGKDEIISKAVTQDIQTTQTNLEVHVGEEKDVYSDDVLSQEVKTGTVKSASDHQVKTTLDKTTIESKDLTQDVSSEEISTKDDSKVSSVYGITTVTMEETPELVRKEVAEKEEKYDEVSEKEEDLVKTEIVELKKHEDGTQIETKTDIDKIHSKISSTVTHVVHEETRSTSSKILTGTVTLPIIEQLDDTQTRSPDDTDKEIAEISKKEDKSSPVVWRKSKSDTSSDSPNLKDRKSGVEFEVYSSSGESHYHSFEMDSGKSRPCSSDVEGLVAAGSSEYETAVSHDISSKSYVTSTTTDYHTPVSSMSSKESMKSLDSESSGNLASIEVSEHSETLVPSTSDLEDFVDVEQHLLQDESLQKTSWSLRDGSEQQSLDLSDTDMPGKALQSVDMSEEDLLELKSTEVQSKMKRSCEMTFQPEPKGFVPDSPQGESEEKLGTSLDDGSMFSMSVSSTSSTGLQRTVIELSGADSERLDGSMTVSGTSEHMSLEEVENLPKGSRENLIMTPTPATADTSTSTMDTSMSAPIESVTITTSVVQEGGIQSVNTQVISKEETVSSSSKITETKKKGHRRTESTLASITIPEKKIQHDMPDLSETSSVVSSKEEGSDEKKDIDESEKEQMFEKERLLSTDSRDTRLETESDFDVDNLDLSRPQSVFSKSDSERPASTAFSDDRPDSELADLIKSSDATDYTDIIERPLSPEPTEDIKEPLSFEEHSPRDHKIIKPPVDTPFEILHKHDTYIRKDSHGKSSSTSSEKSSFEEAEAEAVFGMVAHISPAHKVKQICPIMEDEDAEKHELEAKEMAQKEREASKQRYAEMIKDMSPGFVPDIKITQHMAPLVDGSFRYPDLELEAQERETQQVGIDTPQTPASNSSKSSEETDQGKEYILDESVSTIPEEPEAISEENVSKTEVASCIETTIKDIPERGADSPSSSDSFEMVDKPDLMDDFVVIEEVAKEASELDSEGKSVCIESIPKTSKKHDEEIERYLAHSAPTPLTRMTDVKYYPEGSSSEEMGFDFEESPPQIQQQRAQEYNQELEDNRKWIENQFKNDQAAMAAAGYGYEMEFERAPLEDIKEEDVADFASSYGSQKDSGGSVKESYSSTPEYDVLAGRKYFTRPQGEHDDVSMSSLQEFENLEKAMSLEMRKFYQGSDSSSNGSFKTRYTISKSGQGDDISTNSLKEFEGLEKACMAAHTIEIKAKEEEALLTQIDEGQESIASETESCETVPTQEKKMASDTEDDEDYEKRMFEIDEIIKQAQTNVERFTDLKEMEKTESLGRGDSIEEVSKVPDLELDTPIVKSTIKVQWKESEDVMIASSDSLDFKEEKPSRHDSSDSLDQETGGNLMTASTDSIEFQAQKSSKENIVTDSIELKGEEKSFPMSLDSLEPSGVVTAAAVFHDSIDEDSSKRGGHDHSTSSTGRDYSSSVKDEDVDQGREHVEFSEAMDVTSSTATNATYQYDTDSIYSGSFTSGGSNTMVSSTNSVDQMKSVVSVDIGEAVRKVWFDETPSAIKTTEYIDDSSTPYVTEVIEPSEEDGYTHVIHRRVEMTPEVRKITFSGTNVDDQMKRFIEGFKEGEECVESEEVDEDGNVHIKKVVQRRFIMKGDGTQEPMTGPEIEEYFKQLGQGGEGSSTLTQEVTVRKRDSAGADISQTTMTQQIGPIGILKTRTTRDSHEPGKETEQPSTSIVRAEEGAEGDEQSSDRKFNDQHQLSEEMKELLRELEKESKQ